MKRMILPFVSSASCFLLLSAAVAAAAGTSAAPNAMNSKSGQNSWRAETLTGTIEIVNPARHLIVVQGPDKVPFDLRVTSSTRIISGDQRVALSDLNSDINRRVSVRFVPRGAGDIAQSVRIGSQNQAGSK